MTYPSAKFKRQLSDEGQKELDESLDSLSDADKIQKLEERLEKFELALMFYGCPHTWKDTIDEDGVPFNEAGNDGGARARSVLKEDREMQKVRNNSRE